MSLLLEDNGTMTRKLVLTLSMLVLTAALLLSVPAAADSITLTLAAPNQIGSFGSTVSFTATVSAPSTNTAAIFLNGDSFNVDSPLAVDDTGFFSFPLSMNPGDVYTGVLTEHESRRRLHRSAVHRFHSIHRSARILQRVLPDP